MTPKADLSCRKTYEKWYYIIFYFKKRYYNTYTIDIYFFRFDGRYGGLFEFDP